MNWVGHFIAFYERRFLSRILLNCANKSTESVFAVLIHPDVKPGLSLANDRTRKSPPGDGSVILGMHEEYNNQIYSENRPPSKITPVTQAQGISDQFENLMQERGRVVLCSTIDILGMKKRKIACDHFGQEWAGILSSPLREELLSTVSYHRCLVKYLLKYYSAWP